MNRAVDILWVSDRCPVSIDDLPSRYTHFWGFFQKPFLSWRLLKLENNWLVCPAVHPLCLGYCPQQPWLTVVNKSCWYCLIAQPCPRPDCSLRSLFHPPGLTWAFLHNNLTFYFPPVLCSNFPDHMFFSCCLRGEAPVVLSRAYWCSQTLWVGCRETLYSWDPSATCPPSHTHTILRDYQVSASISSAVAFYSFFVVTQLMVSSFKLLEEIFPDPSCKWDI